MTTTDPVLKELIADTTADEVSIPLDLYLPSGRLYGHTTPNEDFCRYATDAVRNQSAYTGTIPPSPDPEYLHLIVRRGGEEETAEVVRVRLADVIAWTVG